MTLQNLPLWKANNICMRISVYVCVCILDLFASSLHCEFKAFSVYITCLCRGPLKPKLAAMRSAWSSCTPSNISMTSYTIQGESERDRERNKWRKGVRQKKRLKHWTII